MKTFESWEEVKGHLEAGGEVSVTGRSMWWMAGYSWCSGDDNCCGGSIDSLEECLLDICNFCDGDLEKVYDTTD